MVTLQFSDWKWIRSLRVKKESVLRFAFKVTLKHRVHSVVRDSNDGSTKIFICERDDRSYDEREIIKSFLGSHGS